MLKQVSIAVSFFLAANASALSIDLGPATGYNIFVKENFQQPGADSHGKIAVGGNADIGQFDVAVNHDPSYYHSGPQLWTDPNVYDDVLVVGGNLKTTGWGNIKGNAIVGGQVVSGSNPNSAKGTITYGNPIDFEAAFDYFDDLSATLAGLDNTGSINFLYNNWIQLDGTSDADLYVANITGQVLKNATDLTAPGLTQTDTLVINVSGKDIHFDSLNYGIREHFAALDLSPSNILFNFYEAEKLTFDYGGFRGNILAPNADFTFYSGDLSGQVIVKSWTAGWGAQANLWDGFFDPYGSDEPTPPTVEVAESSGWALSLIGIFGLIMLRRRNLQAKA